MHGGRNGNGWGYTELQSSLPISVRIRDNKIMKTLWMAIIILVLGTQFLYASDDKKPTKNKIVKKKMRPLRQIASDQYDGYVTDVKKEKSSENKKSK